MDAHALRRFYRLRGFAPLWSAAVGPPDGLRPLLGTLERSEEHGLDSTRYHLAALHARMARRDAKAAVELEVLLTDAVLRYATHVRVGRVRPDAVDEDWAIRSASFDAVESVSAALQKPEALMAFLASLPPPSDARSLRAGGVGYYPRSDFVHVDVGRVRSW